MKVSTVDLMLARMIRPFHSALIFKKRIHTLAQHLSELVPRDSSFKGLDVGCGSGELAGLIQEKQNNIVIDGVDVLVRPENLSMKIIEFDGKQLPFVDDSYDFVMLVDVLHHTEDKGVLLKECKRVAREFILIKDHFCESRWDRMRLSFMDWVGNRSYNVSLPYSYLSEGSWETLYQEVGIKPVMINKRLNCYPIPFTFLFDSTLHFIAKLEV